MSTELLIKAADQIESLTKQVSDLRGQVAQQKTASDKAEADQRDALARRAAKAKTASDALAQAGLVSNGQNRDKVAAMIVENPEYAIELLAKTAEYVRAPKQASVVEDTASKPASANSRWDEAVARGISRG